jgi:hypothetical protein
VEESLRELLVLARKFVLGDAEKGLDRFAKVITMSIVNPPMFLSYPGLLSYCSS